MANDLYEELKGVLEDAKSSWGQADMELAKDVAVAYQRALARSLAGEENDEELRLAKASAQNIAAGASMTGHRAFMKAAERLITRVISLL